MEKSLGDDASAAETSAAGISSTNEERKKVAVVETRGQGIWDAAQQLSFEFEEFSDIDPDSENYDAKLRARQLVNSAYPMDATPLERDLVISIFDNSNDIWLRGSWVEYLGNDMRWSVAQVRRVVRQAPDSWDFLDPRNDGREPEWNYFYNVGRASLLPDRFVRATEIGLVAVFGKRPFVWQQYALLRLEKFLRFQVDHERDFAEVDCVKYGEELWEQWLDDPRNEEFRKHFDKQPVGARSLLEEHVMSPFQQMDNIVEDKELWVFDKDTDLSVYNYLSVLGSGGFFAFFCLAIQLVIPIILLENALIKSERFDATLAIDEFRIDTTWNQVCTGEGDVLGMIMNLAVLSVYLLTVIPRSFVKFYKTTGDSKTTLSRLNSLREVVWSQGDDNFLQMLGYKMNIYLNTSYVVILYGILLFILFNTTEVLDIILNALAADFIHRIDEEIATEDWFDPDFRWIQAGAVSLVIQSTLRLRVMENPRTFCKMYDIDPAEYVEAMGLKKGSTLPSLRNYSLAHSDDNNPIYKSPDDEAFFLCAQYAKRSNNINAYKQFKKRRTNFSLMDGFVNRVIVTEKFGIFHQYEAYRTWSMWEKVLFLARVPTEEEVEEKMTSDRPINIPNKERKSSEFYLSVLRVLSGYQLYLDVSSAFSKGMYQRIPFHIFDGLLQIIAFIIQLMFPLLVLGDILFIPICY